MEARALVILGAGKLGRSLIRQLGESRAFHRERHGIDYRVVAWADSSGFFLRPEGLSFETLESLSSRKEGGLSFAAQGAEAGGAATEPAVEAGLPPLDEAAARALELIRSLREEVGLETDSPPLLVDLSSSLATAGPLLEALGLGWSVASANKLPLAASQELFDRLTASPRFRYESTVGSAVPVIEACRGLLRNGDRVDAFTGALSGTLGYLMTGLEDGKAFSALVRTAMERGYTEKDPRADLGGLDVARKALILARTLGRRLELSDIVLESLVPPAYAGLSVEDFIRSLPALDADFGQRVAEARAGGKALRYAAALDESGIAVGPVTAPKSSALGALRGNDNLLAIWSKHYPDLPLILQGRGNGVEAAASGVHGDIVSLISATR